MSRKIQPVGPSGAPAHAEGPEAHLGQALGARSTADRRAAALAGLETLPPRGAEDLRFLLERQAYLADLGDGAFAVAVERARRLVALEVVPDLAHHDLARVLRALGRRGEGRQAQRAAVRTAPRERRAFHLWTLGAWQHFDDELEGALESLERALTWSTRERALVRAHQAWVRLDAGLPVGDLDLRVEALQRARSREGYGQFLLGMLAAARGDAAAARGPLTAFLARLDASDSAKRTSLADEIARARAALAGG